MEPDPPVRPIEVDWTVDFDVEAQRAARRLLSAAVVTPSRKGTTGMRSKRTGRVLR
jgi:hypothetical protein